MPGISISRRHPHPITLSPPITTSPSQYHKHQLRPTTRMMSRMLTIAAVAFVSVLGGVLPAVVLAAPEAEEDASLIQPLPLRVRFVNELPNNSIELFWENHDSAPDDPNRRILEAVIPPRGGVHDCSTYVGHGKYIYITIFSFHYYFVSREKSGVSISDHFTITHNITYIRIQLRLWRYATLCQPTTRERTR